MHQYHYLQVFQQSAIMLVNNDSHFKLSISFNVLDNNLISQFSNMLKELIIN